MEGIETAEPEVRLTKSLRERITYILDHDSTHKQLRVELETCCGEKCETIPFRLVRCVYEVLKEAGGQKIYLHTLLEDSDVHLPSVKLPPRNPELEARIQKLQAEQSNREYKEMTRNVDRQQQGQLDLSVAQEVKSLNRQMIAVFNFLVTVGGAFAFGYKATEYALGPNFFPMENAYKSPKEDVYSIDLKPLQQMMTGLIFGTAVFFADLYFLIKYSPE